MDRAGRERWSGARGGQRLARDEPGTVADVFLAAFPALVTELGIVFAQGPPMQLEPVAVLDTPSLEAKRSLLIVELAVHDWCPIALRRTGNDQPAEWLDQLPEVVSGADASHASATLLPARELG